MTHTTTLEFPDELWEEFQTAIKGQYGSVSEALRDLMRQFIRERKEKEAEADA